MCECAWARRANAAAHDSLQRDLHTASTLPTQHACGVSARAESNNEPSLVALGHVTTHTYTPCPETFVRPLMNLPEVSVVDEPASLSTGWRTVVSVIAGTCSDMVVTAQSTHTSGIMKNQIQVPYNIHAVSVVSNLHVHPPKVCTHTAP